MGSPSAFAYGPIQDQACTGINLEPGADIQSAVDNNPAGTIFCLAAGFYMQQSVVPKDNDQFIGAYGAFLNGQHAVEHAFSGSAQNVVIQNLKIIGYDTKAQSGIFSDSPIHGDSSTAWTIRNNEMAYNWGAGLDLGDRMQVIGNYIHHNAQIGIDTNGPAADAGTVGVVVDSNEIAYNNFRHSFDTGWEAGGTKFWGTSGLQVLNNYVHDNIGAGLWSDTDNIGTTYANNVVENNSEGGIVHEVSYDALIKNNVLRNNGRKFIYGWSYQPQILINSSGGAATTGGSIEIVGNTVISGPNGGGIGLEQQDRSTDSAKHGPHIVQNVYVHDNIIDLSAAINQPSQSGVSPPENGAVEDDGEQLMFTSRNNRFVHNTYYLGTQTLAEQAFNWMDRTIGVSDWQGYGQDTTGVFNYSPMPSAPRAYLVAATAGHDNVALEPSISFGDAITLTWSSSSATACSGTGFSTDGKTAGSVTITPTASGPYTVTCTGPGGSASAHITVIVASNLLPDVRVTVFPDTISVGETAVVSWSSVFSPSCTATGFDNANAASGSVAVQPAEAATYLVTCTGSGQSASASASVNVTAAP